MLKIRALREEKGLTQDEMVAKTGIPKRSYVDYESGKADIKLVNLRKIASILNVSVAELIGETKNAEKVINLNDNQNDNQNDKKRNVKNKLSYYQEDNVDKIGELREPILFYNRDSEIENKIPLYDGVIIAGQKSVADLSPQTKPIGYINAGDWFKDATGAMQVYDDSMPEYPTGSYVCFREIKDKSLLIFGQDYVIETAEYRVIKKIQRSKDQQFLILASTNTEIWEHGELAGRMIHEPFPVHIDAITKIYKVLGSVNRKESIFIYQN